MGQDLSPISSTNLLSLPALLLCFPGLRVRASLQHWSY